MHPSRWPLPLAIASAAGLAIGWLPLQQQFMARGWNPGLLNAALVNLALPTVAAGLGVLYPRIRVALPTGVLLGLCFWVGRMLNHDWHVWLWSGKSLLNGTHPIMVIAIPA